MDDILEKGGVSKEIIYFLKAAGYNTLSSVKVSEFMLLLLSN